MADPIDMRQVGSQKPTRMPHAAVLWALPFSLGVGALAATVTLHRPSVAWFLCGAAIVTYLAVWDLTRESALLFNIVLIGLLVGTVVGDRTFAHLAVNLGALPLYITDAALAALLIGIFIDRKLTEEVRVLGLSAIPFLPYLLWGSLLFVVALPFRGTAAIRDYALFYYSVFLLIGMVAVRRTSPTRFVWAFVLAAIVVVVHATVFHTSISIGYGLTRAIAGYSSFYLTAGVLVALAAAAYAGLSARLGIAFFCLIALAVIYLAETRTAWLGLLLGLGFLAVFHPSWRRHLPMLVLGGAVVTMLLGVVAVVGGQGTALAKPAATIHRFLVGFTDPSADATAQFRLNAWSTAWALIVANPVYGGQLGIPFQFMDQGHMTTVPPHNTYLSVLMKSGFVGLALLVIPIGGLYIRVIRNLRDRALPLRHRSILAGLAAAQLSFLAWGGFALLLESPFLAWPFWALIGAMVGVSAKDSRREKSLVTNSSSPVTRDQELA